MEVILQILEQYVVVLTAAFVVAVVQAIKGLVPETLQKKYLPAFAAVLGLGFNIVVANFAVTPLVVVQGLASGLAGTGLYELIKDIAKK